MRTRQNPIYQLLNRDYHENFDLYVPRLADFHELIASKLPSGWNITRHGIWFQCASAQNILPDQGWKIHVSATRANARAILDRVSSILFASADADFKFTLDIPTLYLLNGKNWPRSASGKFITIYPCNNSRFLELLEQLHFAISEFQGPYILTDRRYKDSQVVFFRYGGMKRRDALDVTGERIPMLVAPDGTKCPDHRRPYPETPEWVESVVPLQPEVEDLNELYLVGDGRFRIEGVIGFSSSGGVYRGTDLRSGTPVIIKEARPHIEVSNGHDAVVLLKKEHRLLTLLSDTGIAPQPVDLFHEGTHWFLVEEYVEGLPLGSHSASHNVLLRTRPSDDDFSDWCRTFNQLSRKLLEIIAVLRSRNVVFSDLSPGNLIVTSGEGLRLIDFEGAHQLGVDQPTSLYTPGFVSQKRRQGGAAGFEDDLYSAGAVLLSFLLPVTEFFHLQPGARDRFLKAIQKDARLPDAVPELILILMQEDAQPDSPLAGLARVLPPICISEKAPDKAEPDYTAVTQAVVQQLLQAATYDRSDRLFPADPKLFGTNPLSLAYGACGVAYAIKKITGCVPRKIVDWILKHRISADAYTPGLYLGMSGIAWSLLELGERERAEEVFRLTLNHNLLTRSSDLFYGEAGWAMTSLRFFLDTGNELYLQKALSCGDRLLAAPTDSMTSENRRLGLAHGASGISLFLLYLFLVSGEERFLAEGRRILESDLIAGVPTRDGGLSWKTAVNAPNSLYPFWRNGSAGIGAAVVRYQKVVGDDSYKDVMNAIFVDTDRKHALLPGRFTGLAGIGDFLLDAWEFTGDKKYLASAHQATEGILRFGVVREGIAFPGESLGRLSCDYGTGSAGIAVFLNRLMGRQGSDFLPDELLCLTACKSQIRHREDPTQAESANAA